MPWETTVSATVETFDLRKAIQAVHPLAADGYFDRVRFHLDESGRQIRVTGTNGFCAGLALVDVVEHRTGYSETIELRREHAREVLTMFKAKDPGSEDSVGDTCQLLVKHNESTGSTTLTVTDVSGLFPGKAATWPTLTPDENGPDVVAQIAKRLPRAGMAAKSSIRVVGRLMALFANASAAYSSPLVIEPTSVEDRASLLISCGEQFLGLLTPPRANDEDLRDEQEYREAWLELLGVEVLA